MPCTDVDIQVNKVNAESSQDPLPQSQNPAWLHQWSSVMMFFGVFFRINIDSGVFCAPASSCCAASLLMVEMSVV